MIDAHADWLVCADICVPETGDFHIAIPADDAAASPEAGLFAASDRLTPRPSKWASVIAPDGVLSVTGPRGVTKAWFLPASWGLIDQGARAGAERA